MCSKIEKGEKGLSSSICQVPMKSYFRVEEKCFKISITLNGEPVHCRHKIRFKTIFSTFLKDRNFVFFWVNTLHPLKDDSDVFREFCCPIFDLENMTKSSAFGQVVGTLSDLILFLFGFVKATKFRDSSEYSQCVQNVLAKSCLPCQILYKPKIFFS